MLINVRGTNGSGKSTLVKQLLDRYPPFHIEMNDGRFGKRPKPIRHDMSHGLHVLGHELRGLDGFTPYAEIWEFIAETEEQLGGYTIFESIFISNAKKRTVDLIKRVGGNNVTLLFLDTPADLCVERIYERQMRKRGKTCKVKEDVIKYRHKLIGRMHDYFADYCFTYWIDHRAPLAGLLTILHEHGWREES